MLCEIFCCVVFDPRAFCFLFVLLWCVFCFVLFLVCGMWFYCVVVVVVVVLVLVVVVVVVVLVVAAASAVCMLENKATKTQH